MIAETGTRSRRFLELDGLRGIAAVLVVGSHLTFAYDSKYPGESAPFASIAWGAYGVQLFFFISGFVILMSAQRAKSSSDFVISRFSRLFPVYWLAVTVSIIVSILFRVPHTDVGWAARLLNYTMVQRLILVPNVDEVYWTLSIEMQFYALILALLLLTHAKITDRLVPWIAGIWISVSLVIATLARPHTLGIDPQLVVTTWKIPLNLLLVEWGPFFSAGMLMHLARKDARYRIGGLLAVLSTVVISGILHGWEQMAWVAGVAMLFTVVVLRERTGVLLWRPIQFYGRISYSLYIGHAVSGYAILHLIAPFTGRNLGMVVTFAAVTGIAVVYHRIGEVYLSGKMKEWLLALRDRWRSRRRSQDAPEGIEA
ncbi:acyltransferase family protein [Brachybacterium sp. DNPG3]